MAPRADPEGYAHVCNADTGVVQHVIPGIKLRSTVMLTHNASQLMCLNPARPGTSSNLFRESCWYSGRVKQLDTGAEQSGADFEAGSSSSLLRMSPAGLYVACRGQKEKETVIINVTTGAVVRKYNAWLGWVQWHSSKPLLAVHEQFEETGFRLNFSIVDVRSGEVIYAGPEEGGSSLWRWSPDGNVAAFWNFSDGGSEAVSENWVKLIHIPTGICKIQRDGYNANVCFSADSTLALLSRWQKQEQCEIVNVTLGTSLCSFTTLQPGLEQEIAPDSCLAFSPCASVVAVADTSAVYIHDVPSGRLCAVLRPQCYITGIRWSATGCSLLISDEYGTGNTADHSINDQNLAFTELI